MLSCSTILYSRRIRNVYKTKWNARSVVNFVITIKVVLAKILKCNQFQITVKDFSVNKTWKSGTNF